MKKNLLSLLLLSLFALSSAFAQSRKITGTVTGADDGQALPGVTVNVQGGVGTQTNGQGHFSIDVPANAKTLVFTYVGYLGQTIKIESEKVINVQLVADNKALSEVVVVGYGTGTSVTNAVGNISRVGTQEIQDKPAANAFDAIQGRIPGLSILTSSGEPSAQPSISIDGISSLTSGITPLIILDGTPVALATIQTLNPDDIESITELKDAISTSIYGARAANGVLYVTTKKGSANGQQVFTLSSSLGAEKIANPQYYNSFMNTAQYDAFELATGVETPAALAIQQQTYNADTKWSNVYFKPSSPIYNENFSASGGSDKTTYFISGGYFKEDGLEYRSSYDRYTLRSNVTSKVNNWIRVGLNISMAYDNRLTNPYNTNSLNGGLAILNPPIYSPTNAQGVAYQLIPGLGSYAPYYLGVTHPDVSNNTQVDPVGFLELTPMKGLTIKSQAGMDASDFRETSKTLPSYLGSVGNGAVNESFSRSTSLTFTNTIEYKFTVKSLNHFTVLGGQEYSDNTTNGISAGDTGQSDDRLLTLTTGPNTKTASSSYYELVFKSLFARADYDFNNRYFASASIRQDESSVFGANKQKANFYSVGGSWRAKQENFLKDVSWLTDLTVRASTGTTGNSSLGTGALQYQQLASAGSTSYNGGTGFLLSQPGDPNVTWETVTNTQIGFTTTLFNKFSIAASFYLKTTTNMLLNVPFVGTSGFISQIQNVGSLQNKGIDVDMSYTVYSNPSHKAYITPHLDANFNANKVLSLFQNRQYYTANGTGILWAVGKPISYIDPVWAGVNPANGLPQWYNPSSDPNQVVNKTTTNGVTNVFSTNLQQNLGIDRYPWSVGGFGVSAGYEGITFDANFAYNKGKYITNNDEYFTQNPNQFPTYNQQVAVNSFWKNPGDVTTFPKYGQQFTQFDSRLIQDASFIRLKTLTLGYVLPKKWMDKTGFVKRFEIDFTGRNLLTFTPYKGIDPEVNSNIALGNDPNTKQYVLGLKGSF